MSVRERIERARTAWRCRASDARHALRHSIKLRMVLVFLLLAMALAFTFVSGVQKALSVGWREAARPLLMDYVDRLVADIAPGGHPDPALALALTQRLPLTVRIEGPQIQWASHPTQERPDWLRDKNALKDDAFVRLLVRTTADGHRLEFGINGQAFERRPRLVGYTLTALLLLTLLAYLYVRRLLRPLDDIRAGAERFGAGEFGQPIVVRHPHKPDELGQLATTINTMGQDIRHMLDAKRALLLAISHELRSPLTRARLNTELLPESADVQPQREALQRDLQEMAHLITDLLESERLATRHAALQREPVDLQALAHDVLHELQARHPGTAAPVCHVQPGLPRLALDPARMRLLLRNLLDNALRHSADAPRPPELHLQADTGAGQGLVLSVRDHGSGVPDDMLPHLAQPFFRPDSARTRSTGGVGLGLYLCRLVAQAHGGTFTVENAHPGLRVRVTLPG